MTRKLQLLEGLHEQAESKANDATKRLDELTKVVDEHERLVNILNFIASTLMSINSIFTNETKLVPKLFEKINDFKNQRSRRVFDNRQTMDDERIETLERDLKTAKLAAAEAEKNFEEVFMLLNKVSS